MMYACWVGCVEVAGWVAGVCRLLWLEPASAGCGLGVPVLVVRCCMPPRILWLYLSAPATSAETHPPPRIRPCN